MGPASCLVTVSSLLMINTMPDTLTHRMKSMEPSPAMIFCKALGERSVTRLGDSWRLFLISENICTRKAGWGGWAVGGTERRGLGETGSIGLGDGCSQCLVARWDGGYLHQGTEGRREA